MSAESSIRNRSVDVFHDSQSWGFSDITQKAFPKPSSAYGVMEVGVECQGGGEAQQEVQELGSEGITPKNHSARPVY